ncbi:MAG: hypothetical protein ACI9ND_001232 [Yoonia sp.]|jgi:hypothetical protein
MQAAKNPDEHATVLSYGRHWCLGDLNIGGALGCSVFAKRQTTEEERTTIGESNIVEMSYREDGLDRLTALLRSRALELIQLAVNAALAKVLGQYADAQTPDGRAAIVRNSYHLGHEIQTGAGLVMVQFQRSARSLANWSAAHPRSFHLTFARPKRCKH